MNWKRFLIFLSFSTLQNISLSISTIVIYSRNIQQELSLIVRLKSIWNANSSIIQWNNCFNMKLYLEVFRNPTNFRNNPKVMNNYNAIMITTNSSLSSGITLIDVFWSVNYVLPEVWIKHRERFLQSLWIFSHDLHESAEALRRKLSLFWESGEHRTIGNPQI